MADSATQRKAIALGELIVKELGGRHETDMRARWIAHYIADRMTVAETTTGRAKAQAEDECFKAILALWSQRHDLPSGFRPLGGFEPILRTLERLNPDEQRPFYHDFASRTKKAKRKTKRTEAVEKWLNFVAAVDHAARVLIQVGLDGATHNAATTGTKTAADATLSQEPAHDLETVRRLLRRHNPNKNPDETIHEEHIKGLEARVQSLDTLCRLARHVREQLARAVDEQKQKRPPPIPGNSKSAQE